MFYFWRKMTKKMEMSRYFSAENRSADLKK